MTRRAPPEDPLEILKRRLARGEISHQQYNELKQTFLQILAVRLTLEGMHMHVDEPRKVPQTVAGLLAAALLLVVSATLGYAVYLIYLWNRARRPA